MRTGLILVPICSFILAACGSNLDKEDAVVAFAATTVALSAGQSQAQMAANGSAIVEGESTSFRGHGVTPRESANVNYDWTCTGGGTARYTGAAELALDDTGTSTGNITFDLAAEFDACSVNGITLSGDLTYALDLEGTADSLKLKTIMKGSVSYEGQIDGSCDWDLTMTVAASSAGAGTASAEFSGKICGHDAKATLKVQG